MKKGKFAALVLVVLLMAGGLTITGCQVLEPLAAWFSAMDYEPGESDRPVPALLYQEESETLHTNIPAR